MGAVTHNQKRACCPSSLLLPGRFPLFRRNREELIRNGAVAGPPISLPGKGCAQANSGCELSGKALAQSLALSHLTQDGSCALSLPARSFVVEQDGAQDRTTSYLGESRLPAGSFEMRERGVVPRKEIRSSETRNSAPHPSRSPKLEEWGGARIAFNWQSAAPERERG